MAADHRVYIIFILLIEMLCVSTDDPTIRHYKSSLHDYMDYDLVNASMIITSKSFHPDKVTVFYTHGFKGRANGPATEAIVAAYLESKSMNVILLNWEKQANDPNKTIASSYLSFAIPNAKKIARVFGDALLSMVDSGLDINTIHLIGHSLGAQLFGITGSFLQQKGITLPWITGLDPAEIGFESAPRYGSLNKNSAEYVDIIHTDPIKYGYKRSHGTVDIWPNYSVGSSRNQPGCPLGSFPMFSESDLCSHNRCWHYLIDAIRIPGSLVATKANNYRVWKRYSREQRMVDILAIGQYPDKLVSGNYYLITNDESPFGRGLEGL